MQNNLNLGWIIFSITLLIPGILELYSAYKLSKYLKLSGALMPFWFSISNGVWWTLFSLLVVFLAFVGLINATVDFSKPLNTVIFFSVMILYINGRVAASLQSMFLAGLLDENSVRNLFLKFDNLKYVVNNPKYDLWEIIYNKYIGSRIKDDDKYD